MWWMITCGARLDDVMNYVLARLIWLVIVAVAAVLPGCSASKAWTVGLAQHALLLSPNWGWSEAAAAGAVQRRLVEPIYLGGQFVTDLWIADVRDGPLPDASDVRRAIVIVLCCGLVVAVAAIVSLVVVT